METNSKHPLLADVSIVSSGNTAIVQPVTVAGQHWISENCPFDKWEWFGGALAIDPQYVSKLADGMRASGLNVKFGNPGLKTVPARPGGK